MVLVTKQYVLINLRLIDITGIFRIQSNIYNQAFLRKYLASVRFSKKFRKIHRKTPLPEFFRYLHDNRIERTYRRTLGSDDLTFFNCFRVIFSLKKKKYAISVLIQSLFSTKKSSKVVTLPPTDETLCLCFWRHEQDKWLFQFSKLPSAK